jgi:hypothetical protein
VVYDARANAQVRATIANYSSERIRGRAARRRRRRDDDAMMFERPARYRRALTPP